MSADDAQPTTSFKRVAENLYRAHNGIYYALLKRGGKQIKKSLNTKDLKLAELWLQSIRTNLKPEFDPTAPAYNLFHAAYRRRHFACQYR